MKMAMFLILTSLNRNPNRGHLSNNIDSNSRSIQSQSNHRWWQAMSLQISALTQTLTRLSRLLLSSRTIGKRAAMPLTVILDKALSPSKDSFKINKQSHKQWPRHCFTAMRSNLKSGIWNKIRTHSSMSRATRWAIRRVMVRMMITKMLPWIMRSLSLEVAVGEVKRWAKDSNSSRIMEEIWEAWMWWICAVTSPWPVFLVWSQWTLISRRIIKVRVACLLMTQMWIISETSLQIKFSGRESKIMFRVTHSLIE